MKTILNKIEYENKRIEEEKIKEQNRLKQFEDTYMVVSMNDLLTEYFKNRGGNNAVYYSIVENDPDFWSPVEGEIVKRFKLNHMKTIAYILYGMCLVDDKDLITTDEENLYILCLDYEVKRFRIGCLNIDKKLIIKRDKIDLVYSNIEKIFSCANQSEKGLRRFGDTLTQIELYLDQTRPFKKYKLFKTYSSVRMDLKTKEVIKYFKKLKREEEKNEKRNKRTKNNAKPFVGLRFT